MNGSDIEVQSQNPGDQEGGAPAPAGNADTPPPSAAPPSSDIDERWRAIVPGEYKDKPWVQGRTYGEFWSHVDGLVRAQGRSIILPESSDDPEYSAKVERVYDRLGRPQEPTGYALDLPEGIPVNPQAAEVFRISAHRAGLNQRQFDAIIQDQIEATRNQALALQARKGQIQQEMKERWGEDLYGLKIGAARALLDSIDPETSKELQDNGFLHLPKVVDALYDWARMLQREGMMPDGIPSNRSYEDVNTEIDTLKKSDAYSNTGHPRHAELRRHVRQLEDLRFALTRR